MMHRRWRIRSVVVGCLCVLGAAAPGHSTDRHPLLTDDGVNQAWSTRDRGLVLIGVVDDDEPIALVLNREGLLKQPRRLTLRTDAQECWIASGGALVRIRLPEGDVHQLLLDPDPKAPRLSLNGQLLDDQLGRWVRLCLVERDARVTLKLVSASEAVVAFSEPDAGDEVAGDSTADLTDPTDPTDPEASAAEDGPALVSAFADDGDAPEPAVGGAKPAAEPARPSLLTNLIERVEGGERGPTTREEMLERVKRAVFRVQIQAEDGSLQGVGTGIVLTREGLGVVPAAAAKHDPMFALLALDGVPVAARTLKVDREIGFALVKLVLPQGAAAFSSVPLSGRAVEPGARVWALSAAAGTEEAVVELEVAAVGEDAVPPAALLAEGAYAPTARWLVVSGADLADAAGGALVDEQGELIGVCTPLRDAGVGRCYVLVTSELAARFPAELAERMK